MHDIEVYCDGSIRGGVWASKKHAWVDPTIYGGFLAVRENRVVAYGTSDFGTHPKYNATYAEFLASRFALRTLASSPDILSRILLMSDSQVFIRIMTGDYVARKREMEFLRDSVRTWADYFASVTYVWIPRESNTVADALSRCTQADELGRQMTRAEVQELLDKSVQEK